jgi:outer membrane murein-binding lipoprotein Lpp
VTPINAPLDDRQLELIAEHVAATLQHTRAPRSPWDRRLNVLTGAVALIAFVFSIGVNWSRLQAVEGAVVDLRGNQEKIQRDVNDLRSLVNDGRLQNSIVVTKLDAIDRQVGDIKIRMDRLTR